MLKLIQEAETKPKNFTGCIEWSNGAKAWYQADKRHRLDGPAVENANGSKFWYKKGKLHRLDGPAIEYANGSKEWWKEDKLHRLDGPAIEDSDGYKAWWIKGKQFTEEEFLKKTSSLNEKTIEIKGKKYKLVPIS